MQADLYRVASSFFRIGPNLSCSFYRGVFTALVFVLHPDALMMSGACHLTNTQSHGRALSFTHLESDCETILRCVCHFGSLLTLHRSGSRSQAARCGKRLEFRTCS